MLVDQAGEIPWEIHTKVKHSSYVQQHYAKLLVVGRRYPNSKVQYSTGYDNEALSIDNFHCKYESNGYNDGISNIMNTT